MNTHQHGDLHSTDETPLLRDHHIEYRSHSANIQERISPTIDSSLPDSGSNRKDGAVGLEEEQQQHHQQIAYPWKAMIFLMVSTVFSSVVYSSLNAILSLYFSEVVGVLIK